MIKAIICDLDGVLVNAMSWHEEAFLAALRAEAGLPLTTTDHQRLFAGLPTKTKLMTLVSQGSIPTAKVERVAQSKQRLTQEYVRLHCHPDPTRLVLLTQLQQAGFQLGCVTNCTRLNAQTLLHHSGLDRFLTSVITSDDVHQPKPSPEGYRKACQDLQVEPPQVLAIEDHDHGCQAALAAGCGLLKVERYEDLTIDRIWQAIEEHRLTMKGQLPR